MVIPTIFNDKKNPRTNVLGTKSKKLNFVD